MREEPGDFLRGVGMLAVETRVPIVPFRLVGYSDLYPRHDTPFPWLPEYHAHVRLIVGEPVCVPPGASYTEATAAAKRAIFALE